MNLARPQIELEVKILNRFKRELIKLVLDLAEDLNDDLTKIVETPLNCVVLDPSLEELKTVNPDPIGQAFHFHSRVHDFDDIILKEKSRRLLVLRNKFKITKKIHKKRRIRNSILELSKLKPRKFPRNKLLCLYYSEDFLGGSTGMEKINWFLNCSNLYFRTLHLDFRQTSCANFFLSFIHSYRSLKPQRHASELEMISKFFVYWVYISFSRGYIFKKVNPLIFHKAIFAKEL